ncbi:MAG: AAA family ATPase [Clostridiales bacterium]|nr:AAA family ATPase [Clostridiales bacterium]
MERSLYITKYKNLGVNEPQRFVLNNFTSKDDIGNLVIIVGPNNSGKSNILDALDRFGNRNWTRNDITKLSLDKKDATPQISLCCKANKSGGEYTCRYTHGVDEPFVAFPKNNGNGNMRSDTFVPNTLAALKGLVRAVDNVAAQYGYGKGQFSDITNFVNDTEQSIAAGNPVDTSKFSEQVSVFVNNILINGRRNQIFREGWNRFVTSGKHTSFIRMFGSGDNASELDKLGIAYDDKYGMEFMPHIIRYKDEPIKNSDLNVDCSNIAASSFFKRVFELIDYPIDTVRRAYEEFAHDGNRGVLTKQQRIICKKLSKVADDFNKLYCNKTEKYGFEINLDSNRLFFSIFNGENDCSLDIQSTGFRWFFDLYFNLLGTKTLMRGDIILMDEPATNLHVKGQKELRKFLKEFAVNNGVTIVLATHSPFLVDIDCLDELRVVEEKDGEAYIYNDFSAINLDDPDSLLPVKEALTVDSCHLYDPYKKVVFVEGITDYNYLIAFKKKLGIEDDIIFIPIKGVGDMKNADAKKKQRDISKRLIELRKHNPILLADGDAAGISMKEVNSKDSALTVMLLSDIDVTFKSIESLFDKEDLKKLGLADERGRFVKHASTSSRIKTFADKLEFSETTLANFKKLFDKLADM